MKILKISDGDLVIITHGRDQYSKASVVSSTITSWIQTRGLYNTRVQVVDLGHGKNDIEIAVLTVNDPFDNMINR